MEHTRSNDDAGNRLEHETSPLNDFDQCLNPSCESISSQPSASRHISLSSSAAVEDDHGQLKDNTEYAHRVSPSLTPRAEQVRHYYAVLFLFLIYATIAILSWIITCSLCYHPVGASTWRDQYGNVSVSYYQKSDRLRRASGVGLSVISAIGIPVTSAIVARAAASYCQQNSSKGTRAVTMRQMLALADKGWSGYEHIRGMLRPRTSKSVRTPLLVFATALIITGRFIFHQYIKTLTYHDQPSFYRYWKPYFLTQDK